MMCNCLKPMNLINLITTYKLRFIAYCYKI